MYDSVLQGSDMQVNSEIPLLVPGENLGNIVGNNINNKDTSIANEWSGGEPNQQTAPVISNIPLLVPGEKLGINDNRWKQASKLEHEDEDEDRDIAEAEAEANKR